MHALETCVLYLIVGAVIAMVVVVRTRRRGQEIRWWLVVGLVPCKLCLEQRWPHYAAIALSVIALALARSARLQWLGLLVLAVLMAWSTGLGIYHSGVEWGWFLGPSDCGGGIPAAAGMQDFMKQLQSVRVVSCGEAAWRFLGLSLAGWNAVVSAGLFVLAVFGLVRRGSAA